jgi:hypothetical protein
MELYAEANAIQPSESLESKILNSLVTNFGDDNNFPETQSINGRTT